jgi:hypothetical protein
VSNNTESRLVYFNAPAMMPADISKFPGRYKQTQTLTSSDPLFELNRGTVISRKGWLTPDLTYENDWIDKDSDTDSEDEESESDSTSSTTTGTSRRARLRQRREERGRESENPQPGLWDRFRRPPNEEREASRSTLFPNGTQYGFRFMYNPPAITFSIGVATGINFSFLLSGQEKASPVIGSGSQIGVNLTISRVDDISILSTLNNLQTPTENQLREVLGLYGTWGTGRSSVASQKNPGDKNQSVLNLRDDEASAKLAQIREIAKLGTMHDMNHLFRAFAAKNWKTAYRGTTADIGIAYSVPLVLYLSESMVYRVRLSDLSYTHKIFSPSMIPTLTDVSLAFTRIPDVVGWEGNNGPGEVLKGRI